ncbi:MAG TPA: tape measure protein, partial [Tahibacter sp.]|nr:tape measure protein [Tahibacter sp.]
MANRIVQAVYDLKDNVVGKLRNIGDALRGHKAESDRTTAAVNRNNDRLSASYAASAEGIAKFRNAIVALGAFVGLSRVKDELVAVLETGERFDDLDKALATAFGGVEEGQIALERLTEFAKGVPNALEDIAKEAIKLREGGFDPFDGTLQALIDNQQALDKSTEELSSTVETLSKANIKGELSMKAIVSLTQQGIPVFELLARATGMSEERLRRLAETGQLGKESIRQLVTEIGKLRAGAAEGELGDLDGQLQKIRDTANRFLADIARSGALDFFRSELERLNASVSEAAESGKLQQVAQNISDGIVATAKAIGAAIKFVYDYSGALLALGKVYAAIKVTSFVASLAAVAQRMAASLAATVALT